jgi:hypothetical protein
MIYFFFRFGDGAITREKNDGNFASSAMRNDAIPRHFFFGLYSITKPKNQKHLKKK